MSHGEKHYRRSGSFHADILGQFHDAIRLTANATYGYGCVEGKARDYDLPKTSKTDGARTAVGDDSSESQSIKSIEHSP